MSLLQELLDAAAKSPRKLDLAKIQKAWEFADIAHTDQLRKNGVPFIMHPSHAAVTLIEWKLDTDSVVAGLLHDTIEDGGATREDIVGGFGENVALLVDGVTKISTIRLKNNTHEDFIENLRKMILVMAKDVRVVLVKLADRLHNMETLSALPPNKQKRIATETLEIYAPLAERLGMGNIKGMLEDLAFPYVYPKEHAWVSRYAEKYYKQASKIIEKMRRQVLTAVKEHGIKNVTLHARSKFLYSLYLKLLRPEHNKDITKIHDITALRVVVDSVEECYLTLGIVHRLYHPVPFLGVRDFIANPKPNGYRSIHTNLIGPNESICEVQIRTQEMHEQSEMGVAAHWYYSQAKSQGVSDSKLEEGLSVPVDKLEWVRQLAAWQKEITNNEEYIHALKFDALQHHNLVFSPRGDVYDLPRHATPVDFAYSVHTELGHQAVGAKVNGKMVSLNYHLQNGDIIKIVLDRNRVKPNPDWLDFVVTTSAKHAIRHGLKMSEELEADKVSKTTKAPKVSKVTNVSKVVESAKAEVRRKPQKKSAKFLKKA